MKRRTSGLWAVVGWVLAVLALAAPPVHAQKMYWTDSAAGVIQRANLDGSGVEVLISSGLAFPEGIALDSAAGKIYWADGGTSKIQRANLDGTNIEDVLTNVPGVPAAIALDTAANKVYVTDVATGKIMRANLDGTGLETLLLVNGHARGIALDLAAGKMYVSGAENTKIVRANLDGSAVEDLVTGVLATALVLDLPAGKIYWAEGSIGRSNLDGSGVETLTGGVSAAGLAIDFGAKKMIWTELFLDRISHSDLDGSNVEVLVSSGLDTARDIVVEQSPPRGSVAHYCTAGTSAAGCQATLSASGTASATASVGFDLTTSGVEGAKDGLYFFGTNGRQANAWGASTSFQCVVPPVLRAGLMTGTGTSGACDGSFTQDLNALWCGTCPKPLKNPGAGAVVQAQLWYRDPQNTSNQSTSLSDAIEFTVSP